MVIPQQDGSWIYATTSQILLIASPLLQAQLHSAKSALLVLFCLVLLDALLRTGPLTIRSTTGLIGQFMPRSLRGKSKSGVVNCTARAGQEGHRGRFSLEFRAMGQGRVDSEDRQLNQQNCEDTVDCFWLFSDIAQNWVLCRIEILTYSDFMRLPPVKRAIMSCQT